ncbi:MAG: hypothetical protein JXQ87_01010 [Bacteroidia bacterium]
METIKIIIFSILLAVFYGICHDLVTAHISLEYFTVGHPKVIESESPVNLALVWGVIATWWVGLILGVIISFAARAGKRPKLKLSQIFRPLLSLIGIIAIAAFVAGILGYVLSKSEVFTLIEGLAVQIEPEKHHLYLTVGWSHGASYLVGIVGGIVLCLGLWNKRKGL